MVSGARIDNDLLFFVKKFTNYSWVLWQDCSSLAREGESRARRRVELGGGLPVSADHYRLDIPNLNLHISVTPNDCKEF
jgi:hypothetical protein